MYKIEIGEEVFYEARREDAYALARISPGSSVTYLGSGADLAEPTAAADQPNGDS
jgi:hypothetical protein